MPMIEYGGQIVDRSLLYIDDIGNCCVCAGLSDGTEYYLLAKTTLGQTALIAFGPVALDLEILPKSYSQTFERFDYSPAKVLKALNAMAHKRGAYGAAVTTMAEVPPEEALAKLTNLADYYGRIGVDGPDGVF